MNEYALEQALAKAHELEFSEFEKPSLHVFSLKHRRVMRRILNVNPRGKRYVTARMTAVLAALFLALVSVTAAAAVNGGLIMRERMGKTDFTAESLAERAETIEKRYCLTEIPNGYEEYDSFSGNSFAYDRYINRDNNRLLVFSQQAGGGELRGLR